MLSVPSQHRQALARLPRLSEDSFQTLLEVVRRPWEANDRASLIERLQASVSELDHASADRLVAALLSAHITMDRYRWSPEETATRILEGAPDSSSFEDDAASLRARLLELLKTINLLRIAKPMSMLMANERIYHEARMVTDIRPVFDDVQREPLSYVLVHNLQLEYHDSEGVKTAYFALDSSDLDNLQKVLERERLKLETIRSTIQQSVIPLFEPED